MMILINKSQSEPEELKKVRERGSGSYRHQTILDKLKEDFHNKCYICESKNLTSINVEHFIPHRGDTNLKYSWDNLFWSCAHCNNIKLDVYDNILNCTDPKDDVENKIQFKVEAIPFSDVCIEAIDQGERTNQTVELLNKVYNGSTPLKHIEAASIRGSLIEEMLEFYTLLKDYFYSEESTLKDFYFLQIKNKLHSGSPFTAFKRQVIKDKPQLTKEFGELISLPLQESIRN